MLKLAATGFFETPVQVPVENQVDVQFQHPEPAGMKSGPIDTSSLCTPPLQTSSHLMVNSFCLLDTVDVFCLATY